MRYFFKQLRFVKFKDILAGVAFLLALPISWIFKIRHKNLWLVCERAAEARDNGYWFYKFVKENHPEQKCFYAIKKKSPDYKKVADIDKKSVIEFGSLKHWIYYLAADINISSQKEGKPNAAVCHFLEIYGLRKNRRVYLKHGIVKDDLKWHYYNVMKVWLYTCAAKRELEYSEKTFGYPENVMKITGLARYDNLFNEETDEKFILVLPTSREWLARPIKEYKKYDDVYHFENTEYYKAWREFLTDSAVLSALEKKNLKIVFFLHPNMQKYEKHFIGLSDRIIVSDNVKDDLQTLMKTAAMMITDFSSVFFDFAYMCKPLIYYQFDLEKYREGHYQKGYFDYEQDGFGKTCYDMDAFKKECLNIINSDFVMEEEFKRRVEEFFEFHDNNNCERIFNEIVNKRNGERNAKREGASINRRA